MDALKATRTHSQPKPQDTGFCPTLSFSKFITVEQTTGCLWDAHTMTVIPALFMSQRHSRELWKLKSTYRSWYGDKEQGSEKKTEMCLSRGLGTRARDSHCFCPIQDILDTQQYLKQRSRGCGLGAPTAFFLSIQSCSIQLHSNWASIVLGQ